MEIIDSVWATLNDDIKSQGIYDLSGNITDMIMKQSMNSGTLDNITCIFICFNNFRKNVNSKFNNNLNITREKDPNNSQAFNIKNEYNENNSYFDFHNSSNSIFEEIRRRLTFHKEHSIKLKTNEYLNFNHFEDNNFENKPRTSNEILKTNGRFDLMGEENYNDIEYKPIITETENDANNYMANTNSNMNSKHLYKIVSKKNIAPFGNIAKNYESNLPTFKISQKLNKIPKEINLRKLSPLNKMGNFNNGFNSTTNINSVNININMNNTSRGGNRFLPKITKNVGSTTHYNDKKKNNFSSMSTSNNTSNNQGSFRFNKPIQMNLKLNK